jgi:hypothetical protein
MSSGPEKEPPEKRQQKGSLICHQQSMDTLSISALSALSFYILFSCSMTTPAPATHVEVTLSSLSSDLLMKVTHWLDIKSLCVLDTAINNKQFRAKYLSGLLSDTFLYHGAGVDSKRYEWQESYVQWLNMRRVFVNSIALNEETTASALVLYDMMNRINPGLVSLTLDHGDFPKDMAVRNAKTLHRLEIIVDASNDIIDCDKLMRSVREWGTMGGSLQELVLTCDFEGEEVDLGNCDALIDLRMVDCWSNVSATPGDSLGFNGLLWDVLPKCKNLKRFEVHSLLEEYMSMSDQDLCLLRFCPHLEYLEINSSCDTITEAAVLCVVGKCTKLQHLSLTLHASAKDYFVLAVAANLGSLRSLAIGKLRLNNHRNLQCLAHGCPQLRELTINKGNVNEAELLYLVQHAKNLQLLRIGKWEQLDFKSRWTQLQPHSYTPQHLLQIGIEDGAIFISEQRKLYRRMRAISQTQGEMDTVQRLQAASCNAHFRVVLEDGVV